MREPKADGWMPSAKTIANKHGFLAGALNAAVPKHIPAGPCLGIRLPRDDEAPEVLFLTGEQFTLLRANVTEYWRSLVEFLVASGCRWGEAVALKPTGHRPLCGHRAHHEVVEVRHRGIPAWSAQDQRISANRQRAHVRLGQAGLHERGAVRELRWWTGSCARLYSARVG
jgi:hypothetical protein